MFILPELSSDLLWNRLQEPARPAAGTPADVLLLLSALENGWEILDATLWRHPSNEPSDLYSVTVFHPRALITRSLTLRNTPQAQKLLKNEAITLVS